MATDVRTEDESIHVECEVKSPELFLGHPWPDPLARTIIDRVRGNGEETHPEVFRDVPPEIRRHREYFRRVAMECVSSIDPSAIHHLPEFIADIEVRRAAGLGSFLTADELRRINMIVKFDPRHPDVQPYAGHPLDTARIRSLPSLPSERVLRTCDACGKKEPLEGRLILSSERAIEVMQANFCRCMEDVFQREDLADEDFLELLRQYGKFVPPLKPFPPFAHRS